MGVNYIWDTNTAIYYLQQQFPPNAEKFMDGILRESQPSISSITEIELLCWKTPDQKDLDTLNSFINDAIVIELERAIKLKTAEIRKLHKIKLPDAIIAATAVVYGYTLLSRNVYDFKNIEGLKLVNPWEPPV